MLSDRSAAPDILSAPMAEAQQHNPARPLRVLLSAGEASGDQYGADLIRALGAAHPGAVECFGLGGERMAQAGCETVVAARDVAVVGLFEVVSHLPGIFRQFHELLAEVDRRRPDVAVLIDFPDWNLRLAEQLHRRGIPVVYYVSPQLWAWRRGRVHQVQSYVHKMLVIFPFERDFYARHGVEAEFVGHPLCELQPPRAQRGEFARRWGLDTTHPWIALLPGSRRKELRLNLPAMLGAAARLGGEFEFVLPVASTLDSAWVREQIAECAADVDVKVTDDARSALLHARAAVVASGTATVEAALMGTPFVMVYRLGGLTWTLGRHLVKVPHYGMVNLIAEREVVPELIQENFTAERVERELRPLLSDGPERLRMVDGLTEARLRLCGAEEDSQSGVSHAGPAERAALAVLRVAESSLRGRE
jgi:lipid-A-disaccharide synthase